MDQVRLPDLEVIKRFSIAVRSEHAPIEEVLEALRADLAKVSGGGRAKRETSGDPVSGRDRKPAKAKPKAPARRTGRR